MGALSPEQMSCTVFLGAGSFHTPMMHPSLAWAAPASGRGLQRDKAEQSSLLGLEMTGRRRVPMKPSVGVPCARGPINSADTSPECVLCPSEPLSRAAPVQTPPSLLPLSLFSGCSGPRT